MDYPLTHLSVKRRPPQASRTTRHVRGRILFSSRTSTHTRCTVSVSLLSVSNLFLMIPPLIVPLKDYKIDSTNSTVGSFKTALPAGDHTPFTAAVVIDMGVFGPDGLSERNVSYTGQNITYPLKPKEHTTIQQLVKGASSYEFVLHPGKFPIQDAFF